MTTTATSDAGLFTSRAPDAVVHALGGRQPTHQQWAAISAPLEPAVLIAGAGAGKTAVMAARIVWLVIEGHARASEILGLTFTNKAAENLLQRVRAAIAPLGLPEGEEPAIATYHGFAASVIADYGLRAGLEPGSSLMSEAQAWQLCSELLLGRSYEHLEVRSLYHVGSVRHLANECADHLVDPRAVAERDRLFLERLDEAGRKMHRDVVETAHERIELAGVAADYQRVKRARHLLDYGDQISIACDLAADERVQEDFRARFKVVLLDEYQDTNHAQAVMLQRLMTPGYPVMAVGDPDQNIYAWRGASLRNLLAFAREFRIDEQREAHTMPLVVNFRSGARILDLANAVIDKVPAQRRPPDKVLQPFPERGLGEIGVVLAGDQVAEAERIADEAQRAHAAGTPWAEIAILARKKRLFGPIVEVFRAREIPLEVIGLGGLLRMPEVIDLVSLLRVLDDPLRNVALARLLRGPRWRIGHRDIARVARAAMAKNKELDEKLADRFESPGDVKFSLAEALDDVESIEGVSDEGRARMASFRDALRSLRARVSGLALPELVAEALDHLGLVRELDASPSPAAASAKRNLANFLDRVAAFEPLDGEPTLGALIDWLDAYEESDEEIEAAQPSDTDSVKVMTVHQAKGLEFDVVFIPGLSASSATAAKIFPDTARQPNPATSPKYLPFELRGDAEVLPAFDGNLAGFKRDLEQRAMEEERRLLYVAITRARKRLVCTAAHWYEPSGRGEALKNPMGPSDFWREIRAFPGVEVIEEVADPPDPNPLIGRRADRATAWPPDDGRRTDPLFPDGLAAAVEAARAATTPDDTLFPVDAPSGPRLPTQLPVSAVVTYATCPKRFFWSYVRPLPRRATAAARIGTVVHTWIEQRGRGQTTLYDPEDFEERPRADDTGRLAELRDAYLASRFADRVPLHAERAFALVLDGFVVQGRIDAIFERDGGGWEIVDWKSGRAPEEPGAERWQLDLYALAASEVWGMAPEDVTVTFVYLGDRSERSWQAPPADETRARLREVLAAVGAGRFEVAPSAACGHCDFRRDCPEGTAFLT